MTNNDNERLEDRQIRKVRNRLKETINKKAPETLIRMALQLGVHVPKNLVERYVYGQKENPSS